jgi:hypothetical protein
MITFTIAPDGDEKYELKATTRDILNWEKTTKGASLKKLMEELAMVDLYKVAHFAAKRTGQFTGSLQDFEATNDLEFELEEDADPTQSAP